MTRPRGFSLFEIVIAFALLSLVMLLTYRMMVPGLRAWTVANEQSRMQQNALIPVTRITHEMQQTCIQSVVTDTWTDNAGNRSPYLAFVSPFDRDGRFVQDSGTGGIVWQEYRVFYLDASGVMRMGSRPIRQDANNNVQYQLSSFAPDPLDRPLSRSISRMEITEINIPVGFDPFEPTSPTTEPANPVMILVETHDERKLQRYVLRTAVWTLLPTN